MLRRRPNTSVFQERSVTEVESSIKTRSPAADHPHLGDPCGIEMYSMTSFSIALQLRHIFGYVFQQ